MRHYKNIIIIIIILTKIIMEILEIIHQIADKIFIKMILIYNNIVDIC